MERLERLLTLAYGAATMDDQEQAHARMGLAQLNLEHDDFHAAIEAMIKLRCDPLQIQRMKKKKLELKDRIKKVSSTNIPDSIA